MSTFIFTNSYTKLAEIIVIYLKTIFMINFSFHGSFCR